MRGENCSSRVSISSCIDRKTVIIVYHIIKLCVLSRVLSSEDILITFYFKAITEHVKKHDDSLDDRNNTKWPIGHIAHLSNKS